MIVLHSLFLCIVVFFWSRKEKQHHPYGYFFITALLLKIICGFLVGLVYLYWYEGGDTIRFFREAVVLQDFLREAGVNYLHLWWEHAAELSLPENLSTDEPRVFIMVKILTGLLYITGQNYWLASVYMSLVSFWGCWRLSGIIRKRFPGTGYAPLLAFFFLPSVVFWSSGILKESLMMGLFTGIIYLWLWLIFFFSWKKVWYIPVIIILWSVLWQLKYYYAAPLIPVLISYSIVLYVRGYTLFFRKSITWIPLYILILVCCIFPVMWWHPNLNPDQFLYWVVENHDRMVMMSDQGDYVDYGTLEPTFKSIFIHAPQAVITGLFRPFLWEVSGICEAVAGIENFLVMVMSFTALGSFFYRRQPITPEIFVIFTYVVTMAVFLALASPNLGALNRYRIGYFAAWVMLILIEQPNIIKRITRPVL